MNLWTGATGCQRNQFFNYQIIFYKEGNGGSAHVSTIPEWPCEQNPSYMNKNTQLHRKKAAFHQNVLCHELCKEEMKKAMQSIVEYYIMLCLLLQFDISVQFLNNFPVYWMLKLHIYVHLPTLGVRCRHSFPLRFLALLAFPINGIVMNRVSEGGVFSYGAKHVKEKQLNFSLILNTLVPSIHTQFSTQTTEQSRKKSRLELFKNTNVIREYKATQPEVDSKLQHMEQPQYRQAQAFLNLRVPLKVLVAVPEPAEGLDKNGRAHEKQQQESEGHVGLFIVEMHSSAHVQHDVEN